jgi:hypothetical protein
MPLGDTFTQALSRARRSAQISGRPLSQQETAGIAEGVADTADERAARLRALELEQQRLAETARANRANERAERERSDQATHERKDKNRWQTATQGAMIGGYATMSPVGAAVGFVVGYFAGDNSYICSEVYRNCKDDMHGSDMAVLKKLWQHADNHHTAWLTFYRTCAPIALSRIRDKFSAPGQMEEYCTLLLKQIIHPVLGRLKDGDEAGAFEVYKAGVLPILLEYAPEFGEAAKMIEQVEFEREAADAAYAEFDGKEVA